MAEAAPKRMNVEEYLAWAMEQPERPRFELHCGEVHAVATERNRHALTKLAAAMEFVRAQSGLPGSIARFSPTAPR